MTRPDALIDHLTRSQACKKTLSSLVKRYGIETCDWALHQLREDAPKASRAGRKVDFEVDALRDIWLFVEVGKSQTGESANAFCRRAICRWVTPGVKGATVTKELHGQTLRRRYHEAATFLRATSAPFENFAKRRDKASATARISPTETWWRKLLAEQLARLSGNQA